MEKTNRTGPDASAAESQSKSSTKSTTILGRLNARISAVRFLETRGIERVPESDRHDVNAADYMQMTLLWFSTNITANNIALGMLGPISYELGFVDAALCATFGSLLGAAGAAYMGTWGPVSGNRTMVCLFLNFLSQ
jgi:purine-cytosine permease-like protein